MDIESLIRFACVTNPGAAGIAFDYLQAVEGTKFGVRVMPIGAMHFGVEPWSKVSHLFISALKNRFINVVCVEPGTTLGDPFRATQLVMTPGGVVDTTPGDATIYEPPLALSALLTVGIPNVAILSGDTLPEGKEADALKHYTAVVCPSEKGTLALDALGINAVMIPPESGVLKRLFSGMNPA